MTTCVILRETKRKLGTQTKTEGTNSESYISKIKGIHVILAQMNINSGFYWN